VTTAMKPKKPLDLVAFWRYDAFPFLLGGHVTDINKNGSVETREFGPGHFFKPVKILPVKEGEAALAKLSTLRTEHDQATRALAREWKDRLVREIPWSKG
jgi:hypothetical protein